MRVRNGGGRERGLRLVDELAFSVRGLAHTFQVAVEPDGSLRAVPADAAGGPTSCRFRFLRPSPPAGDGAVTAR